MVRGEYPKYVRVPGQPDFIASTPEAEAEYLARFSPPVAPETEPKKEPDQPDLL